MPETTIAAIVTPHGAGGVAVVRLSGTQAFNIAEEIFRPRMGGRLSQLRGYSGALGDIFDADGLVDQSVAFVFRSPKSYTGEDVVELSVHGGMWVAGRVLRLCYKHGAIPAGPGEFTRRAFTNGKMDLSQAEAVMDVIAAESDAALRAATSTREGAVSRAVREISQRLLTQSAHLAAWSDFPEEDLEPVDEVLLAASLREIGNMAKHLLATYDQGRILFNGVTTVIVGTPNTGKSTLMNMLAGCERSIVTEIPGTTRDIVTESVRMGDITLRLSDTAGLRDTSDLVEKIGVERTREQIELSELVLAVFDNSRPLEAGDREILSLLKSKPCIAVINKSDLPALLDLSEIRQVISRVVILCAKTGEGYDELVQDVTQLFGMSGFDASAAIISNERQYRHLYSAHEAIGQAVHALECGLTLDAAGVCIDEAHADLLSLTGERVSDKVVYEVFSRFCVGK